MADHHQHHGRAHAHPPEGEPGPIRPLDPAAESLSAALRFGFNVLGVIMILLVTAYAASGLFQVNPGEQGLIVRFGRLAQNPSTEPPYGGTAVFGPGWHASFPQPVDEKVVISGAAHVLRLDSFLFRRTEEQLGRPLAEVVPRIDKLTPGAHGAMLSGDRNLSHGLWTIEYRIEDAEKFVRNVGESTANFIPMLRVIAENAVLRSVAGMTVERIILRDSEGGVEFTPDVQRVINAELTRLGTGVLVSKVTAETVEPGLVRQAFLDVTRAQNQRQSSISEARQQYSRILNETAGRGHEALLAAIEEYGAAQALDAEPDRLEALRGRVDVLLERAEGAVAVRLREAQSRASEIRERVRLEFEEFVYYRSTFRRYPRLTTVRLWVQMRDTILSSRENEIFFVPAAGEIEIITNRDPQRLIEADIERYRRRFEGQ